jgi:hypothetical protein
MDTLPNYKIPAGLTDELRIDFMKLNVSFLQNKVTQTEL